MTATIYYNMSNIVIAIRTYGRLSTIANDTLALIEEHKLPYPVWIFCPEEEKREYLKRYKGKYHITSRGETIQEVNDKIIDYFTWDKKIIQMDDDCKEFLELDPETKKLVKGDLKHYIEEGFKLCEENGFKLWGFYPVKNAYFMKDQPNISKGLKFIMGGIHGIINDKNLKTKCGYRDDYERTILNYDKYGGVIRFNWCKVDNRTLTNKGGLVSERSLKNMTDSTNYMLNKYSEYCRAKKSKSKYPEISLVNKPYCIKIHIQKQLNIITWSKNCDRPNVSGLDEEKSKNRKDNVGFPCYSYTFGCIRPRGSKKGVLQDTRITEKYPLIFKLASELCKSFEPNHEFTTITINKDIVCQPHTDKYNNGDSLIISVGDYTEGGNLYVEEKDGTVKKYDTRKPLYFNGAKFKHWNDKANSQRFSFVYFRLD